MLTFHKLRHLVIFDALSWVKKPVVNNIGQYLSTGFYIRALTADHYISLILELVGIYVVSLNCT